MNNKKTPGQIFAELERIANMLPSPIYWLDTKGVVLGANDLAYELVGGYDEIIIGKEHDSFYPKDVADSLTENNNKVIQLGQTVEFEEIIVDMTTGLKKFLTSIRAPLRDDGGKIIGIIGTSIDITDRKEKERLAIENEQLKFDKKELAVRAEEQERFKEIVSQAVHDIRSPLSSLQTIVKNTLEISEQKRIALRRVVSSIGDIANYLLSQYQSEENGQLSENNRPQAVLASLALAEIVGDRRHKYKDLPIEFEYNPDQLSNFAFIKVEPSNFRRMVINLINNAVDAMPKKGGIVKISFIARDDYIYINIEDDGKGIPEAILHKIQNNIIVTHGKENGHGLGLAQVRETLNSNHGEFKIFSRVGKNHGTDITITLPRIVAPAWIAEEINLTKDDLVVILDDDESIHEAWESRFSHILEKLPTIHVRHFTQGQEVIDFFAKLSALEKQKVYLLSDYELIKQKLNGLQIIKKANIIRATLVTSHYIDLDVRKRAVKQGVRILPKELANNVPIKISQVNNHGELANVHMVIVDDDQLFMDNLIADYYSHLVIDTYINPIEFLNKADQYPHSTRIILDNNYYNEDGSYIINGISIAMQLHEKGFTNLYLISGEHGVVTPDYLPAIFKGDEESLARLDKL